MIHPSGFRLLITSCLLIFLSVTGIRAQDKSQTPDGNSLPRSSYYHVQSVVPVYHRNTEETEDRMLPCFSADDILIRHTGYVLSYNGRHKQANWVAYELTAEETRPTVKRSNRFITDPKVTVGSSSNNDYKSSGFDRGHLAPSADMCYSTVTMQESFYLSNMSPQKPGFNRGIWKNLEDLIRQWAREDSVLLIVTGGVLTEGLSSIGPNKVSVPEYYYKVIADCHGTVIKGIGFIIPNEKSKEKLQHYAVSIDSVESLTGFNFFCRLPDDIENAIERVSDTTAWPWRSIPGDQDDHNDD